MQFASKSTLFEKIISNTFSPVRSFSQTASSDEDKEWRPSDPKTKTRKATRDPTSNELKPPKRNAKRSEPKESIEPQDAKYPKPGVSLNPAAEKKTTRDLKNTGESGLPGTKKKQSNEGKKKRVGGGNAKKQQAKCPEEQPATTSGPSNRIKEEARQMAVSIFTTQIFLPFKTIDNFLMNFVFVLIIFFLVFFFVEGLFYFFRSSAARQMLK